MRAALRELHEETGIRSARIVASVRVGAVRLLIVCFAGDACLLLRQQGESSGRLCWDVICAAYLCQLACIVLR